jgi:2-polyprenyl-3-methyl-5-hydroxy-6-metoxy-1,4-benzoquinol methylase
VNDSKALWLKVHADIPDARVTLGRASSHAYATDPRMIGFMAARYKFVAKMLDRCPAVVEVGCGDGFGAPVVAQSVDRLVCTDIDEATLRDNARRLSHVENVSFEYFDFRAQPFPRLVDAIYGVDVIEHVYPEEEASVLANIAASLVPFGIAIVGTPNATAERHASETSRRGHVNLKDHESLRGLLGRHFERVFLLSMNDEVVHTGFHPMAHYLWGVCVGPRR